MKRHLLLAALAGLVSCLVGASMVLAADDGAWRSLFDGRSLDGWEQHGGKAVYKVEDGAVVGHSVPNTQNSFLCTKERFTDFELLFEVQDDPRLNSGVQIRSNIKENDRVFGPQVEIEVGPGEQYPVKLSRNIGNSYGTGTGTLGADTSMRIKADTAACVVVVEAFER